MSVLWHNIRHFRREEWVHDPDLVEPDVVYLLDEQRAAHGEALPGVRYVVHVAWDRPGSHDARSPAILSASVRCSRTRCA